MGVLMYKQAQHSKIKSFFSVAKKMLCVLALIFALQFASAKEAKATCCACSVCPMIMGLHIVTETVLSMDISTKISSFFTNNVINGLTNGLFKPHLQMMTLELSTAALSIVPQFGAMIDGQVMNNSILALQTAQIEAAQSQIPSVSMCEFATLSKSVGAADHSRAISQQVLAKHNINRLTGTQGLLGASGSGSITEDLENRFREYLANYCDPKDQNNALGEAQGAACSGSDARINKDIDYTNLMQSNFTMGIDFTSNNITDDERDVFAMAKNLYSPTLFIRPERAILENPANRDEYVDMMAFLAKKSVAANSFFALVGLKTENPQSDVSYYDEMNILTKEYYRDPAFFAKLYDNPANVMRQKAAMQGIGLMQQRDIFESQIRSEMLLSVILETKLAEDSKDLLGGLQ